MSTDSFRAPDRIRVIDAFRGIAILCVMAFHYWGAWFPNAWLGVEFFFIISGFVIFLTLERHCRSLLDFVMRRVARLYPTFVFCAVCSFTLAASGGYARASSAARELVSSVFLVAPYLHVAWLDGAYWSLLIEAKFYFWAGLLYFAAPSRFAVSWALFTLGAATAAQFFYGAAYAVVSAPFLPFFAYGIGCYLQYRREAITRDSILLYAAALIAYGMLWRGYPVIVHAEVAAMAAAFQLFLARRLDWLTSPPLLFVGLVSYPLYLLHYNFGLFLIARFSALGMTSRPLLAIITGGLMILAATLVHYFVEARAERPLRAALERLTRRSHPALG